MKDILYNKKRVFDKDDGHTEGKPPTTYYNMITIEKQLLIEYIDAVGSWIGNMTAEERHAFDVRIKPRLTSKSKESIKKGLGKKYTLEGVISDLYNTAISSKYNPTESMINRWNRVFIDEGYGIRMGVTGTAPPSSPSMLDEFFE